MRPYRFTDLFQATFNIRSVEKSVKMSAQTKQRKVIITYTYNYKISLPYLLEYKLITKF